MMSDNSARWALLGDSVVAFAHVKPERGVIARPLHRLPGPVVVVAERFAESPIGAFSVLSIGSFVRLGVRPALHYFVSVVSSTEARRTGRSFWGFPYQLGTLTWNIDAVNSQVRWEEQELTIHAHSSSRSFPFVVPVRSAQIRTDGPVVVPEWSRGRARRSVVDVSCADQGPGAFLKGQHNGFTVSGLSVRRMPARVPYGVFSSLRAPLRPVDPGVAGMRRLDVRNGGRSQVRGAPPSY